MIETTSTTISYSGNGATVAFAFPYRFLADSHLEVRTIDEDDVETVEVLDTDYTVAGEGLDAGGTVTFVAAPASNITVQISRIVPLTQLKDYIPQDAFPATSHEDGLDKLTMICQQLQQKINDLQALIETGDNTTSARTFENLQAVRDAAIIARGLVFVVGPEGSPSYLKAFRYDSTSLLTDDASTILRPTIKGVSDAGRYLQVL